MRRQAPENPTEGTTVQAGSRDSQKLQELDDDVLLGTFQFFKLLDDVPIHHGPESRTPLKAEYIGADQLPFFVFGLQLCGGPYIPITRARLIRT